MKLFYVILGQERSDKFISRGFELQYVSDKMNSMLISESNYLSNVLTMLSSMNYLSLLI